MTELPVEPPTHGRDEAGHSSTVTIHHPAATTVAPAATSRWANRRPTGTAANTTYTSTSDGRIMNACSSLHMNAVPTSAPLMANQRTACALVSDLTVV